MNFFFGAAIRTEDLDGFTTIQDPSNTYHYCVEYGSGAGGTTDFVIRDSLNRSVPIHISSVHELMNILAAVSAKHTQLIQLESAQAEILDSNNHVITQL